MTTGTGGLGPFLKQSATKVLMISTMPSVHPGQLGCPVQDRSNTPETTSPTDDPRAGDSQWVKASPLRDLPEAEIASVPATVSAKRPAQLCSETSGRLSLAFQVDCGVRRSPWAIASTTESRNVNRRTGSGSGYGSKSNLQPGKGMYGEYSIARTGRSGAFLLVSKLVIRQRRQKTPVNLLSKKFGKSDSFSSSRNA